jgi:hypothetical protein
MSITNDQKELFLDFLNRKVGNTKSGFIVAMHEKLTNNQPLTPNMIAALNRCIESEAVLESKKVVEKTFKIKKFLMRTLNIDSRYIKVNVEKETGRAYKVTGMADFYKTSNCVRCGRQLTQPASFTIGFGPECASILGIEYPKALNSMDEEAAGVYRAMIIGKLHSQKVDAWIPKSQIEKEIFKDQENEAI